MLCCGPRASPPIPLTTGENDMSLSRSTLAGLAATTAAGLALAGCQSSSAAGPASGTASATAAGTAQAAASAGSATGTSAAVSSGAGAVAYFPDQLGDKWVYSIDFDGKTGTVTNKITAVTPVSGGTQVVMTDTDTAIGSDKPFQLTYEVHSDGSISIPLNLNGGSGIKVTSGGLGWPGPGQLASGKPANSTITMTETVSGTTVKTKATAVTKGEGTQSVSVPAGSYQATLVDEEESEKFMGTTVNSDDKTWLADGVGPVKSELGSGSGSSSGLTETEELISFTKG
jgi:hypothetical protein